jgi:hypothetical protein
MTKTEKKPGYGDECMVLVGAYKRRRAKILPIAATGRRTNTICVRFHDGGERWVKPRQIYPLPDGY